ncbi:MAG: UDP-N-acetyl-D-glucosamine dehydrogenase, partial [Anaerolineae bacterium]|nr:UDP-N-acetyl-D-glucosamine dehydrogenase [Anaerolineae bacterium]
MSAVARSLVEKITSREAQVGVVGLGYVGLPLAVAFTEAGFRVTGIEVDPERVAAVQAGQSYIPDVPSARLAPLVAGGHLQATQDYATVRHLDAVSICVPTPLGKTRDPDMSYIVAATEAIAAQTHAGLLVVLESTTYPGTTEEVVLPRLLRNGLTVGEDLFVAFSPERVDPGNPQYTIRNTPKVIGGVTPACLEV